MISRRLIRIKIVQVLYAFFTAENQSKDVAEKELQKSIKNAYDLYQLFALLLIKVADYAEERIELARAKNFPTPEESNPNIRFINNKVITQLRKSVQISQYTEKNHLSWFEHPDIVKKMYLKIIESDYYKQYMEKDQSNYVEDKALVLQILNTEIEDWDYLYQLLEEKSIYWNDDIEFVVSILIRTIENFKENSPSVVLQPLYKNDEDRLFGFQLMQKTLINSGQYREQINKYTKNWDVERVAALDVIIMMVAISEIVEFPTIPVKVTLNEFIDIAKYYSTEKSNEFVNGILDKIVADLRKDKKFEKVGRGLTGENETEKTV